MKRREFQGREIDTIALYPHCSRGRARHIKNAVNWWLVGVSLWLLGLLVVMFPITRSERYLPLMAEGFPYVALGSYVFFGIVTISMTRKWMVFVRLAEKVFRTLGLPDPSNIDLVKSSKAQRKPDDPGEFGTFYFRY